MTRKQHNKLIGTPAGYCIGLAHALTYPSRHLSKHVITTGVPQAVVYLFEAVDVDIQNAEDALIAISLEHGLLQPIGQQKAIWKARYTVEIRQILQLLLFFQAVDCKRDIASNLVKKLHLCFIERKRLIPIKHQCRPLNTVPCS